MLTDQQEKEAHAETHKIGYEHGKAAASWVTNGNTTRETYVRLLKGLDNGDPEILDELPTADLSGQWADGYTPAQLGADCGISDEDIEDDEAVSLVPLLDDLCRDYESAFAEGVEDEIRRVCEYQLDDVAEAAEQQRAESIDAAVEYGSI